MRKIKVTARKYGGDDAYSWAVFRSDQRLPVVTGLSRAEVPYHKRQVEAITQPQEHLPDYGKIGVDPVTGLTGKERDQS